MAREIDHPDSPVLDPVAGSGEADCPAGLARFRASWIGSGPRGSVRGLRGFPFSPTDRVRDREHAGLPAFVICRFRAALPCRSRYPSHEDSLLASHVRIPRARRRGDHERQLVECQPRYSRATDRRARVAGSCRARRCRPGASGHSYRCGNWRLHLDPFASSQQGTHPAQQAVDASRCQATTQAGSVQASPRQARSSAGGTRAKTRRRSIPEECFEPVTGFAYNSQRLFTTLRNIRPVR